MGKKMYSEYAMKQEQFAQQRVVNSTKEPSSIAFVMTAMAQLEIQVYNVLDEFQTRLERGGVLQDIPSSENPTSNLPSPNCRLVCELLERRLALENFSQRLKTLLERLAI